jgi:hypothetical protein
MQCNASGASSPVYRDSSPLKRKGRWFSRSVRTARSSTAGSTAVVSPARELRWVSRDSKVEEDQIREALVQEVLKRDVVEGDKADAAKRLVARAANRSLRSARPEPPPPGEVPSGTS